MNEINVRLLGTPKVVMGGDNILFPFKKAEGLFYYLLIKREATREELVNLLWPDLEEEKARKNLRNALYKLKKAFNLDILISPKKSIVMINSEILISIDIDNLIGSNKEESYKSTQLLNLYSGEFLQGFSLKDAEYFEEWLSETREHFKEIYIKKLYEALIDLEKSNNSEIKEAYLKKIIILEPYDEIAYRMLINHYIKGGLFNRAIDTFNRLKEVLDKELGISPDGETMALFERIVKLKKINGSREDTSTEFFYGRERELSRLINNYNEYKSDKAYKSIIIMGEAGVGKTRLKQRLLEELDEKTYVFETNCYQAEEKFILKPWNSIFSKLWGVIEKEKLQLPQIWENAISYLFPAVFNNGTVVNINPLEGLDTIKFQMVEEAIAGVLRVISEKQRIVLIFEDIQWMDSMSLSLLSSLLLHRESGSILFLGTCRNEDNKKIEGFISTMVKYNRIDKISLDRFTKEEVREFICEILPEANNEEELMNKIYEETEGNAFFLIETLNSIKENGSMNIMTSKMQDILKSRFLDISDEGKKLLRTVSMFFDEAPLDIIKELSSKDELEIIDLTDELEKKFLLREIGNDDKVSFKFTHQKLREFIYMQLSPGKRKILHNKIGAILEKSLKNEKSDMLTYSRLIYHFKSAGNKKLALKYSIKNADMYMDFSHELFPVLNRTGDSGEKYLYINQRQVQEYLDDIEHLIKEIESERNIESKATTLYKIAFYHMQGRYYIREGEYTKGREYIQNMIENSIRIGEYNYAIKGYRQMIYCGIQTHDVKLMDKYLELAIPLSKSTNDKKELGILLRLKGLSKIMSGEYQEAEALLVNSIETFDVISKDDDRYILNIAAAYNYMGEIRRYKMQFLEALSYYDRAISITEQKKVLTGLTVFNTNAGQTAFEMGNCIGAKKYFSRALGIFDSMDTMWGRSTAEGYMALLDIKEGKYNEALSRLKKADYYSSKIKSPKELGVLYRIKAEIKSMCMNRKELNDIFDGYLTKNLKFYCEEGIEILSSINHSYELEVLKILNRG